MPSVQLITKVGNKLCFDKQSWNRHLLNYACLNFTRTVFVCMCVGNNVGINFAVVVHNCFDIYVYDDDFECVAQNAVYIYTAWCQNIPQSNGLLYAGHIFVFFFYSFLDWCMTWQHTHTHTHPGNKSQNYDCRYQLTHWLCFEMMFVQLAHFKMMI